MTKRARSSSPPIGLALQCAKGCGAPSPRALTGIRWSLPVSMDREREMRSSGEAARSIAAPRVHTGVTELDTKSPVRADGEHGWWPTLPDRIGYLLGFEQGFRDQVISSPSTKLAWRKELVTKSPVRADGEHG